MIDKLSPIRISLAAAALALGLTGPASAFPAAPASTPAASASVVPVYGGCGPYGHRGPYGGCRPGGQAGYAPYRPYRACPPGWHLGPYGQRCWRN